MANSSSLQMERIGSVATRLPTTASHRESGATLCLLRKTQPDAYERLQFETESPRSRKFLARLQGEVGKCHRP